MLLQVKVLYYTTKEQLSAWVRVLPEPSTSQANQYPEGPQFSTRAESNLYRSWGGSVINMSALPEAKLAREAEMVYQMICMATDYDCWHSTEGDVDVEMVMGHMSANSANAKTLVGAVLDKLSREEHSDMVTGKHWEGKSSGMIKFMTKKEGRGAEGVKNIEYLFPGVFD